MPANFNRTRHYRLVATRYEKLGQAPLQRESHMQLQDFAQVVRSKNAGPRHFTLDVIFRSDPDCQRAAQSEALTADKIARLYGAPASAVQVINYPLGRAIKIVLHNVDPHVGTGRSLLVHFRHYFRCGA